MKTVAQQPQLLQICNVPPVLQRLDRAVHPRPAAEQHVGNGNDKMTSGNFLQAKVAPAALS